MAGRRLQAKVSEFARSNDCLKSITISGMIKFPRFSMIAHTQEHDLGYRRRARPQRKGRHLGVIPNRPEAIAKLAQKTVGRHGLVEVAYEAGPSGYGIYRH